MPIVLRLVYVFCWRDVTAFLEGAAMESNETGSSVYFVATTSLPRIIVSCVWRLCLDKRHRGLVHKECCCAPVQLGGGGAWYATGICMPVLLWKWRHLSGDGQSLLLEAWLLWDMLWLGRVCRRPMK